MPSLLKAFSNLIRGKKDDLAKKMADPVRDGRFAIEDSEKQIAVFTEKIALLVAETKRLERQRDDARAEVEKFTRIAQKAAQAGNEVDVRKAVEMKGQAQQRLTTSESEITRNQELVGKLREQLSRARARVAQARSNLASLSARMEGAKVRQELAKASTEFNSGGSPLAALDDLDKAVKSREAEADAWEEMAGMEAEGSAVALEEKYSGSGGALDDEVAKLMAAAKGQ